MKIGYFGASTGGGAALWAAAHPSVRDKVSAVVSRGGRPDLAIPVLKDVSAPVLCIVGGADVPVIGMNQEALRHVARGQLRIVPGATHLFEEPGEKKQSRDLTAVQQQRGKMRSEQAFVTRALDDFDPLGPLMYITHLHVTQQHACLVVSSGRRSCTTCMYSKSATASCRPEARLRHEGTRRRADRMSREQPIFRNKIINVGR